MHKESDKCIHSCQFLQVKKKDMSMKSLGFCPSFRFQLCSCSIVLCRQIGCNICEFSDKNC